MLYSKCKLTNKQTRGWGAKEVTEDSQTQARMGPSLGKTVPMFRGKAMGSRATVLPGTSECK